MNARRRAIAMLILAGMFVVVAVVQLWIVSAGRWRDWPEYTAIYDPLADGFLLGQTSLSIQPKPELLALSNPYDADANAKWRLHDATLFNNRYYVYWGPVPALLLAGVKAITGLQHVGDQYLTFSFSLGTLFASFAALYWMWSRWFAGRAVWILAAGAMVAGLSNPMPFVLGRAAVYEAAILAGQCFLVAGIYCGLRAGETTGKQRAAMSLACGILWAMAMGSRISLAPLIVVLVGVTIYAFYRRDDGKTLVGLQIRQAAWVVVPVLCAIGGLAIYNYVRFGSFTEFGWKYLLASKHAMYAVVSDNTFAIRYVPANAFNYLTGSLIATNQFPFIRATNDLGWYAHQHNLDYYGVSSIAGMAWTSPYLLFALVPAMRGLRLHRGGATPILLTVAAVGAAVAPLLLCYYCTMRYLADWVPLLTIAATIGLWQIEANASGSQYKRFAVCMIASVVLLYTCGVGVLLGVTGLTNHFQHFNPKLLQRLQAL